MKASVHEEKGDSITRGYAKNSRLVPCFAYVEEDLSFVFSEWERKDVGHIGLFPVRAIHATRESIAA